MKFLLKFMILSTVALIIYAKAIETKQITGSNTESGTSTLTNAIQSGLNLISPKQPERTIIKRVCKIKPNGNEECKNIQP